MNREVHSNFVVGVGPKLSFEKTLSMATSKVVGLFDA